jgi:hypothetical protein
LEFEDCRYPVEEKLLMAAVCIAGLEFVGSSYSTSVDVHLDSRVAECATRLPQTPGVKSFEIGNTSD